MLFRNTFILILLTIFSSNLFADCADPDYWNRETFPTRDRFYQVQIGIISLTSSIKAQNLDLEILKDDLDSARYLHAYGYISLSQLKAVELDIDRLKFEIENNNFSMADAQNNLETLESGYLASCQEIRDSSQDAFLISRITSLVSSWERRAILSPQRIDLRKRELQQAEEYLEWAKGMRAREFITQRELLVAKYDRDKRQNVVSDLVEIDLIINKWAKELKDSIELISSESR